MLTVTQAAAARLVQMLKEHDAPDGAAVRFVDDGKGIAMGQDSEREGDATFDHEGRTVLLLDAQVSELLSENTLDVEGGKLTLQRPEGG